MSESWNEVELIDYIEGELDEARSRAIDARLAHDDVMRTRVARLRSDRAVLRAVAAADAVADVPGDLLEQIEPQIARSVLTAPADVVTSPGAYRRRHRDQTRRMRRVRFAQAAGLLLALSAAVWGAFSFLGSDRTSGGGRAADGTVVHDTGDAPGTSPASIDGAGPVNALAGGARAPGATPDVASGAAPGELESWPPAGMTLHHDRPLPAPPGAALVRRSDADDETRDARDVRHARADRPVVVTARFVLVMPGPDHDEVEAMLARALATIDGSTDGTTDGTTDGAFGGARRDAGAVALVRNFSFDEARHLMSRFARRDRDTQDLMSGIGTGRTKRDRERLADAMSRFGRRQDLSDDETRRLSRRLLGPRRLAPSYQEQLDLSSAGATHTVTLPVASLAAWLRHLRVDEARATSLRPLADDDELADRTELQQWIHDHGVVRSLLTELGRTAPDGYVRLPIVLVAGDDR